MAQKMGKEKKKRAKSEEMEDIEWTLKREYEKLIRQRKRSRFLSPQDKKSVWCQNRAEIDEDWAQNRRATVKEALIISWDFVPLDASCHNNWVRIMDQNGNVQTGPIRVSIRNILRRVKYSHFRPYTILIFVPLIFRPYIILILVPLIFCGRAFLP